MDNGCLHCAIREAIEAACRDEDGRPTCELDDILDALSLVVGDYLGQIGDPGLCLVAVMRFNAVAAAQARRRLGDHDATHDAPGRLQ